MSNFDTAIDRLLGNEGGYTDGKGDPGGATNWGISKRSYPDVDIKNLTRDQAVAIYRRDFWNKIDGDTLLPGIGFQLLDFAVNSGISTATKALQRSIGVDDDGDFGPVSLEKLNMQSDTDTIMKLLAERLIFMTSLHTWQAFGQGWARRIAANLKYGAMDT